MAGEGVAVAAVDAAGLEAVGAETPEAEPGSGELPAWAGGTGAGDEGRAVVTADRACDGVQAANDSNAIAPAMSGCTRVSRPLPRRVTGNPGVRIEPICAADLTNP